MKISKLQKKWKQRKKFSSYQEMPTSLVILFGLSSFLVASFYGYVLGQVAPEYINIANQLSFLSWGVIGWTLTFAIACLLFLTWYMGNIWWRCNSILRERYFQ